MHTVLPLPLQNEEFDPSRFAGLYQGRGGGGWRPNYFSVEEGVPRQLTYSSFPWYYACSDLIPFWHKLGQFCHPCCNFSGRSIVQVSEETTPEVRSLDVTEGAA